MAVMDPRRETDQTIQALKDHVLRVEATIRALYQEIDRLSAERGAVAADANPDPDRKR